MGRAVQAYGEMDYGAPLYQRYELALGDIRGIESECECIDDVRTLGNAVFSQCRYITHWAMDPRDEWIEWLNVASIWLEEIARNKAKIEFAVHHAEIALDRFRNPVMKGPGVIFCPFVTGFQILVK